MTFFRRFFVCLGSGVGDAMFLRFRFLRVLGLCVPSLAWSDSVSIFISISFRSLIPSGGGSFTLPDVWARGDRGASNFMVALSSKFRSGRPAL